jgi:hypothetical protein
MSQLRKDSQMKIIKWIIISILFVFFLSSHAVSQDQVKQGVYRIGGGLSFSSSNTSEKNDCTSRSMYLSISPQFAYLIIDNLEVGGALSYYYQEYSYKQSESEYSSVYSSFFLGPRIRYYVPIDRLVPFFEASFGYDLYGIHGSDKIKASTFTIYIGLDYFLKSYVAIEPCAYYEFMNSDRESRQSLWIGVYLSYFISD